MFKTGSVNKLYGIKSLYFIEISITLETTPISVSVFVTFNTREKNVWVN